MLAVVGGHVCGETATELVSLGDLSGDLATADRSPSADIDCVRGSTDDDDGTQGLLLPGYEGCPSVRRQDVAVSSIQDSVHTALTVFVSAWLT